ncbi:MAG: hypothetical protein ACRBF0_10115 [Calditrichia bacterium]
MFLFDYAIDRNRWLWFHILAGGVAGLLLISLHIPAISGVFIAACIWEAIEALWNHMGGGFELNGYGNEREGISPLTHFLLDAVADITGAVLMAAVVVA